MDTKTFYRHVSSWIASYRDPDALQWVRRFVANSRQTPEGKQQLATEIDRKAAQLQGPVRTAVQPGGHPALATQGPHTYVADAHGHPRLYSSRYQAICHIAALQLRGYHCHLRTGPTFHRIAITATPAPCVV